MWKRIKWLLFDAPTSITTLKEETKCDYCGSIKNHKTKYPQADFTLCYVCLKKMADKLLTKEEV